MISETESDNQQRQIHQEAHRVFRSRRHISEDLENEHLEPRDMDNVREWNIDICIAYTHTLRAVSYNEVTKMLKLFCGCLCVSCVVLGAHHRGRF